MNRPTFFNTSLCICLLCAFCYFVFFGQHGFIAYLDMQKNIKNEQLALQKIHKKIVHVSRTIQHYQDPHALEKMIRYDLCMGYTNELVYLLKSQKMA